MSKYEQNEEENEIKKRIADINLTLITNAGEMSISEVEELVKERNALLRKRGFQGKPSIYS